MLAPMRKTDPMKRTTVNFPDELGARLRHEAEHRGTTVSAVTRAALEAYLDPKRLSLIGLGRSGRSDVAQRVEEILREEWGHRGNR